MAANKAREPNRKIRVSRGQAAAGMDCPYLPSGNLPVYLKQGLPPGRIVYQYCTANFALPEILLCVLLGHEFAQGLKGALHLLGGDAVGHAEESGCSKVVGGHEDEVIFLCLVAE